MNNKELAIIIPVYNEEKSINKVVNEYAKVLDDHIFDIVIINDGSTDDTLSILKNLQKKYTNIIILNKKNGGHNTALIHGYKFANKRKYEYIFQTDSDDQFLSNDFFKLWNKRDKYKYSLILGDRFNRQDPFLRIFLSRVILRLITLIFFKKNIIDPNIPFRLITKDYLNFFLNKNNVTDFIAPNLIMSLMAHKYAIFKVSHIERKHGQISWPVKKIMKFGFKLMKDIFLYKIKK